MREADRSERVAAAPDAALEPARLARELIMEIFGHARECYPEECCGILTGPEGGRPERVVRCTNVQNQRLARGESELDATRAFWIDERELYQALREADERDHTVRVVYHSHIDTAPYLSHTDQRGALGPDGSPLWPGSAQLVVSVSDGVVREAALYEWNAREGRFLGRRLAEPGS
jgi:proteasome lid subunit RPN8/RPN11